MTPERWECFFALLGLFCLALLFGAAWLSARREKGPGDR